MVQPERRRRRRASGKRRLAAGRSVPRSLPEKKNRFWRIKNLTAGPADVAWPEHNQNLVDIPPPTPLTDRPVFVRSIPARPAAAAAAAAAARATKYHTFFPLSCPTPSAASVSRVKTSDSNSWMGIGRPAS
ncbi:unnamed protein product [Ectocarpus sp. 13 AM-2016]